MRTLAGHSAYRPIAWHYHHKPPSIHGSLIVPSSKRMTRNVMSTSSKMWKLTDSQFIRGERAISTITIFLGIGIGSYTLGISPIFKPIAWADHQQYPKLPSMPCLKDHNMILRPISLWNSRLQPTPTNRDSCGGLTTLDLTLSRFPYIGIGINSHIQLKHESPKGLQGRENCILCGKEPLGDDIEHSGDDLFVSLDRSLSGFMEWMLSRFLYTGTVINFHILPRYESLNGCQGRESDIPYGEKSLGESLQHRIDFSGVISSRFLAWWLAWKLILSCCMISFVNHTSQ